jgi:hypothetical protein
MNVGGRGPLIALGLITLLIAVGACGYLLLERMRFQDALFMTIITITTLGYGEVKPLYTEHEGDRVRIVAPKRGSEPMTFVPEPQMEIQPGDFFVAIGARPSLQRLAERVGR